MRYDTRVDTPLDLTSRVIRRYGNRKLYDVRTSAYVALEDLAAMVRAGETLQIVDNPTGEDITAQTLTQVILDEGKRGPSLLPSDLLHGVLRRGSQALDAGRHTVGAVRDAVRRGTDDVVHHSVERIARVLPAQRGDAKRGDELDAIRRQLADVERTLATLVARQAPDGAPAATPPAPTSEETR